MKQAYFLEWMTGAEVLYGLLKQLVKTYRTINRIELLKCVDAGDGDFINGVINLLTYSGREDLCEWYMNDINIHEVIKINEHIIYALKKRA